MPTTLACPSCRAALKFADGVDVTGKKIRCAKCRGVFTPGAAKGPAPAKAPAAAPPKVSCPGCKVVLKVPANFPAGKKIKCPKCSRTFAPTPARPPSPSVSSKTPLPAPRAATKVGAAPKPAAAPRPAPKTVARPPVVAPPPRPEPVEDEAPAPAPKPAPPRPAAAPKPAADDEMDEAEKGRQKRLLIIAGALFLTTAVGYYLFFSGPSRPPTRTVYAAAGTVLYKGKPAEGAQVSLIPEEKGKDVYSPQGTAGPDGTFKLSTYGNGDGAPVGRYKVAITWLDDPASDPAKQEALLKKLAAGEAPPPPKNRLPEKYSDPNASGISVEIKAESNQLEPFDLK